VNFIVCSFCDGRGWVPVYSHRIVERIRAGRDWNHCRTMAVCSCELGERHLEHFEKAGRRPAAYTPERFCRDESLEWAWLANLNPEDARAEIKRRHEKHVRDWLAGRGTELVGTFSLDEWGANHGG